MRFEDSTAPYLRDASYLLVAWKQLPRGAHQVLELILELKAGLGLPLDERAAELLRGVNGSSKTAKLARELLKLSPASLTPAGHEARFLAAEKRLDRAEKWAMRTSLQGGLDVHAS